MQTRRIQDEAPGVGGLSNEGLDLKLLINGGLEAMLQCFIGKIKLPGGLQPGPWICHCMQKNKFVLIIGFVS
jgi:hypothetical protein